MSALRNFSTEKEISERLENLVQSRFTKESLESKLSEIFGTPITLDDISREDDDLVDFNFLGHFDIPSNDLYGYFDIYFLKMRKAGFDGSDIYITEIAVEFE